MEIRELSVAQLTEIYNTHMRVDFPPEELKPLDRILTLQEKGLYKGFGWVKEEPGQPAEILAYALLVQPEYHEEFGKDSYVLMDYYAVCRGNRGQGVGSAFLSALLPGIDCRSILFEVEDPAAAEDAEEREIRERRMRFYHRLGLRATTGLYTKVFGVVFEMLTWNKEQRPLSASEMKAAMSQMYRKMLTEELFEKNVQLEILD